MAPIIPLSRPLDRAPQRARLRAKDFLINEFSAPGWFAFPGHDIFGRVQRDANMTQATSFIAISIALSLIGGVAVGQGLLGPADPELKAAQQSLRDAMVHLQKSRNSSSAQYTRAQEFIALAARELGPGTGSLAAPLAPPPQRRALPPQR